MSQIIEPDPSVKKPVAKRSWVERLMVWGGILVLLVVVAVEWTSRRSYEETLDKLDTAIRESRSQKANEGILAADVERHVRGFAFRGQFNNGPKKYQTFQWPSLFRYYKLIVLIDRRGVARTVDAFAVNPESRE